MNFIVFHTHVLQSIYIRICSNLIHRNNKTPNTVIKAVPLAIFTRDF